MLMMVDEKFHNIMKIVFILNECENIKYNNFSCTYETSLEFTSASFSKKHNIENFVRTTIMIDIYIMQNDAKENEKQQAALNANQ